MKTLFRRLLSPESWSYDVGLLILRLCMALMLSHGWSKFQNFSNGSADWPDPFHVGPVASKALTVFAELVCTAFIVVGLYTRVALIPLIICFVVVVFVIHGADPMDEKEHALLFLLPYLTLLFTGPGAYSLDGLLQKAAMKRRSVS